MNPLDKVTPTLPGNRLRRAEDRRKPPDKQRKPGQDGESGSTHPPEHPDTSGIPGGRPHIIDDLA